MNAPTPGRAAQKTIVDTPVGPLAVFEGGVAGGEPLVLWPSIFTDHRIYDGMVERLGERYRFVLIDGPGHGASPGLRREFTMRDCALGVAAVMDACGLASAVVGGTSWGGLVGAELALTAPERVQALILLNTPMSIDGKPGLSARFIAFGARWTRFKAFRDGVAGSFFSPETLRREKACVAVFHAMLSDAEPRALAAAVRSVMLHGSPLIDRLAGVSAPTLVVAGEADAMYPLAEQQEAARRLRQGRFAAVDGKHISVVEAPDQVAEALRGFLEETSSGRGAPNP